MDALGRAELGEKILAQVEPDLHILRSMLPLLRSKIAEANDRDPYYTINHILSGIITGIEGDLAIGSIGNAISFLANDDLYDLRLPFPEKRIEENLRVSGKLKALHEKLKGICEQEPEALKIIQEYNQRLTPGR